MHAFFHRSLQSRKLGKAGPGRSLAFKEAHAAYKLLSNQERDELRPIAESAKSHTGRWAFGVPMSVCKERAVTEQRKRKFLEMQQASDSGKAVLVYESAVDGGTVLSSLEGHRRLSRAVQRKHAAENRQALQEFRTKHTPMLKRLCLGTM